MPSTGFEKKPQVIIELRNYILHWMKTYSVNGIRGFYFHKDHDQFRELLTTHLDNLVGALNPKSILSFLL